MPSNIDWGSMGEVLRSYYTTPVYATSSTTSPWREVQREYNQAMSNVSDAAIREAFGPLRTPAPLSAAEQTLRENRLAMEEHDLSARMRMREAMFEAIRDVPDQDPGHDYVD